MILLLRADEVIPQALKLRALPGMSYTAVASVMREYHRVDYHPDYWRKLLRAAGADAKPHGPGGFG